MAELLPCDEGYERNPDTNRCRKVLGTTSDAASADRMSNIAGLEAKQAENPWGWITAGMIGLCALGYAGYEWRSELAGIAHKLLQKYKKV